MDGDNLKVCALRADDGACFYDRIKTPLSSLYKHGGWTVAWKDELYLEEIAKGSYDLFIGQRISTDEMITLWKLFLHPSAPACIQDLDDLLFDVHPTNFGAFEFYREADVHRIMAASLAISDALTVSTEPLAAELRAFNPHVAVIPNYLPKRLLGRPKKRVRTKPIVGWAGGSSHMIDLNVIADVLPKVINSTDAKLRFYGMDFAGLFELDEPAQFTPWFHDKSAYVKALDLDIGLCPLVDNRFNRCKSHVKALEYSFRGIPTVASNVTPYKEYVIHGVTGFLCNDQEEWEHYLRVLIGNPELRYDLGCNAYEHARAYHVAEDHAHEVDAIYRAVLDKKDEIRALKWAQVEAQIPNANELWAKLYGVGLPALVDTVEAP